MVANNGTKGEVSGINAKALSVMGEAPSNGRDWC